MTEVKVFTGKELRLLQEEVNDWLKENEGVEVIDLKTTQGYSGWIGGYATLTILYKRF